MKRFAACILALALLCSCATGKTAPETTQPASTPATQVSPAVRSDEVRAVWISCYELPDAQNGEETFFSEIDGMFGNIAESGFNTVFVHVRPFADALYPSELFPWSKYSCGGRDPGFDPLRVMVECAHERGLKIHAWINPFRISLSDDFDALPQNSPARSLMGGSAVAVLENGIYFNPASTDVHALIYDGVREILDGYEVDGIHIDDYFYPTREESIDRAEYESYTSEGGEKGLNEWRRDSVSAFAAGLYSLVKSYGREKIFSISPAGNIDGNENMLFADVELWLSTPGYADYLVPQIYFGFENSSLPFEKTVRRWANISDGRVGIVWGLAVYKSGKEDENARAGSREWIENSDLLSRQVTLVRSLNAYGGFALFSYSYIYRQKDNENVKKEMQNLKNVI